MAEVVRVLRVIEYVGERAWVEETLKNSIHGVIRTSSGEIRTTVVDIPSDVRTVGSVGGSTKADRIAEGIGVS